MGTQIGSHLSHIRHGLSCGRLPKGAAWIARDCDAFRRTIEGALIERNEDGGISVYEASLIQTAIRWERHAMMAQRWLRLEHESMTSVDKLHFSREIAKASAERDKALKALRLDRREQADILATLYREPHERTDDD